MSKSGLRAKEGLVIERLDGEALVYDPSTDSAHHLTSLAVGALDRCDASSDVESLVAELSKNATREEASAAITQLVDAGLLIVEAAAAGRRQWLRTLATGCAVVAVTSLGAANPASAAPAGMNAVAP